MHFLFLFLDGVGLGTDNPEINPFAAAEMPYLCDLLDGKRLLESSAPLESDRATLIALDATLGVEGLPQSATGQATLITGKNVPAIIKRHYGPKPNPEVAGIVQNGNLFQRLKSKGKTSALLNAYPPRYFKAIESGKRIYSAIPLAVTSAEIPLKTAEDLYEGKGLSADFTGQGWRDHLDFSDAPIYEPVEAGERLSELVHSYDLGFFEYWISDYIGHKQDMKAGLSTLHALDQVLNGLINTWSADSGLIFLTSDHGNLEDLSTRRHTTNKVPGLIIGAPELRNQFAHRLNDLADVTNAIIRCFDHKESLS